MYVFHWLRASRARRGVAAACVVLATGGLILFRAPANAHVHTTLTPTPDGANVAHFSGPRAHGTVALSGTKVLAGSEQDIFAEVKVAADKEEQHGERAPLALAVVLDTSGSMEGEKIQQAKNAVRELIDAMRDDDEIAMVRYSDTASIVQPLARVGTVREGLVARVKEITAGGGTAIPLGLSTGLSALGEVGAGRVERIVLVSDGLDSTRVQAENLAQSSFARGITISSMGIGLDFDESYMAGVARAGHGNFGFVKDASALATFLHRELDETATTTIANARVRIRVPRNVRLVGATGADASTVGDDEIELKLGSLFAGDERRAILHLAARAEVGETLPFQGSAAWNLIGGGDASTEFSGLTLVATGDRAQVEASSDRGVLGASTSVIASERELKAAEAYARGDTTTANSLIDQNITELKAAAAAAPAPAAAALGNQWQAYDKQKKAFTLSPHSAAGKAAAKDAFEKDTANATRASF
jgi:Ca-activated chloride channel family protein